MNSRQRRRQRRRINADPELHGLQVARNVAYVGAALTLVLVVLCVVLDTSRPVEIVAALVTGLMFLHATFANLCFRVRLLVRQKEWSVPREDIADVFEVDDELVSDVVTQEAVQDAFYQHEIVPHFEDMADRITRRLHASGDLPAEMTLRFGPDSGVRRGFLPERTDDE